ncbi:aspartate racemase [Methylobacterium currus]|uniref:Aspartate racemase n=1 Tax=Methylobacterium currus TaxID=2051553 RepID=A0A2R4WRE8_9HYPH|nr:aspartate/glutamate racemase family protein [Methylobacterium currus]AWB24100.1 aspartate racemase [Methylobacterium currus]
MRHGTASPSIGIVSCSAEGAALCYCTICAEGEAEFGPHGHPEIMLHGHSLAAHVACLDAGDWAGVAALMLSSAAKLAAAGATFLICPDNTIHQAMPWVLPRSPRPWLHIAEVVAAEAERRGYRRLGVTGTHWLVAGDVYPQALATRGLDYRRPSDAEQAEVGRLIMDELVRGRVTPEALAYCQGVVARMAAAGCDAVILGCTELPLLLNDGNSPLPILDSTRLLARAALRRARER